MQVAIGYFQFLLLIYMCLLMLLYTLFLIQVPTLMEEVSNTLEQQTLDLMARQGRVEGKQEDKDRVSLKRYIFMCIFHVQCDNVVVSGCSWRVLLNSSGMSLWMIIYVW